MINECYHENMQCKEPLIFAWDVAEMLLRGDFSARESMSLFPFHPHVESMWLFMKKHVMWNEIFAFAWIYSLGHVILEAWYSCVHTYIFARTYTLIIPYTQGT